MLYFWECILGHVSRGASRCNERGMQPFFKMILISNFMNTISSLMYCTSTNRSKKYFKWFFVTLNHMLNLIGGSSNTPRRRRGTHCLVITPVFRPFWHRCPGTPSTILPSLSLTQNAPRVRLELLLIWPHYWAKRRAGSVLQLMSSKEQSALLPASCPNH